MNTPVIVLTGASSGFGAALAHQLGSRTHSITRDRKSFIRRRLTMKTLILAAVILGVTVLRVQSGVNTAAPLVSI